MVRSKVNAVGLRPASNDINNHSNDNNVNNDTITNNNDNDNDNNISVGNTTTTTTTTTITIIITTTTVIIINNNNNVTYIVNKNKHNKMARDALKLVRRMWPHRLARGMCARPEWARLG